MDIVTDLTAQAVSCLTIVQDLCKIKLTREEHADFAERFLWDLRDRVTDLKKHSPSAELIESITDTIGWGLKPLSPVEIIALFFDVSDDLLDWLAKNHLPDTSTMGGSGRPSVDGTLFCTPYQWRKVIRAILYSHAEQRIALVQLLHYVPVQIVFCLGGKKLDGETQRRYQIWNDPGPSERTNVLWEMDPWWDLTYKKDSAIRKLMVKGLLSNDQLLLRRLNDEEVPLPFETFFNKELNEICIARNFRLQDNPSGFNGTIKRAVLEDNVSRDPLKRAADLELHGLALSGGGIRSATFNLGVIQRLAELNMLSRIDYLSTVSGGGYIGTWLASWIKRGGSVSKISDRLDSQKSSDPLGEEVRPIRWLRMFSNYLAPDASLMSADSWTMGMTWLRNTMINQIILLLLLTTGLSLVADFFKLWLLQADWFTAFDVITVGYITFGLFIPVILMAGAAMHVFELGYREKSLFLYGRSQHVSVFLSIYAIAAAYYASAWFYHEPMTAGCGYMDVVHLFFGAAVACFTAMLIIAYMGYYQACAQRKWQKRFVHPAIVLSSATAALAGLFLFAGVWELLHVVKSYNLDIEYSSAAINFILGPPLVLEALSICVVIRMALLGNLFPDERREWWGRMGAIVHRYMLFWLLISVGALVLPTQFENLAKHKLQPSPSQIAAVFGGWAAVIGFAVKLAYQSKDAKDKPDTNVEAVKSFFIKLAPYLFMLGFLLIGAYTLQYIMILADKWGEYFINGFPTCLLVTLLMLAITLLLSWRIGVNEFSLHHFYRNRLVRAYLGATRKRTERDKTANSFTGFDKDDDIKLAQFVANSKVNPYTGPFPLINTTLNATAVSELDRQDRKAESFIFTPLFCGFDFSPTRSAAYTKNQVYEYGYRPTAEFAYANGPMIGTAMAISGAAVSPNMGYHSSPATAFLLTMFNVRLGWWIGNPRLRTYWRSDPDFGVAYLLKDLIGTSDIDSDFVCLSDGGHFDNMGLYELIRRRCVNIILSDAEEDASATCEGLANAIRRCRIDFGAEIDLDVSDVTKKDPVTGFCKSHSIKGTIRYPGDAIPSGKITYIKTSLIKTDSTDIREYHLNNPLFPQQPTSNQFFTEEQFESYRKLGYLSI